MYDICHDASVYMNAISLLMIEFHKAEFVDELPVSTQPKICMLAQQASLFVGEMRLWMNQSDDPPRARRASMSAP